MHGPDRLKQPVTLAGYLETMSKAVFQAGISWKVVDAKWPGIRESMKGFSPLAVSKFSGSDIDRLMQDARLIRNRRKLEGIVLNARRMLEMDKEFKGFRTYLRSQGTYDETAAILHRDFKFLGESGAYYFLWVVGENVPPYEEWLASRGG